MAYSKLYSSIIGSSLWSEPDSVRILFITMLAMCDKEGVVYGSKLGIGRIACIEPDEIQMAINTLLAPDKDSSDKLRAPENEGRRIEEIPGGFRLLNFAYYRGLRNDDDRREQNRIAQAKFKAKVSQAKPASATVSHGKPISEAEAAPTPEAAPEAVARKERSPLSEQEFLDGLRSNPAYSKIDIDLEIGKMRAWLSTRPGRKLNKSFALRWLNKVDVPLEAKGKRPDGTCPIRPEDLPKVYIPKGADRQ